jgi:hypothetical protein
MPDFAAGTSYIRRRRRFRRPFGGPKRGEAKGEGRNGRTPPDRPAGARRELEEPVPFQPWAKALYDERAAGKFWREEPDANCLPKGVP